MTNPEMLCHDLSDRLLLLRNTFKKAKEGYLDFDPQSAKTFLAMLDESYQDAVLLEGAAYVRGAGRSAPAGGGSVVAFPGQHVRPHLIDGPEGAA